MTGILQPMKPAKLDLDKPSHKLKLDTFFDSPQYIAEPKIDGCHYFCDAGRFLSTQVSSRTKQLVDKTDNFPHLVEAFFNVQDKIGQTMLDGEINFPGDEGSFSKSYDVTTITGCSGVEAVRRQTTSDKWVSYTVFDILRTPNGEYTFNWPWRKRRELLEEIMQHLVKICPYYILIPVRRSRKKEFLENILKEGGEGVVFKFVHGIYIPSKRPMDNWIKYKTSDTDDVVIMGFDSPNKEYTGKDYDSWPYWEDGVPVSKHYYNNQIGSIVFGKYNESGELVFLGSCTGIDDLQRAEFSKYPKKYIGKVIQIKFMEMTADGKYRHPNFVAIHHDKNPNECIIKAKKGRAL
jgi:ATP-dependent DNA ligase